MNYRLSAMLIGATLLVTLAFIGFSVATGTHASPSTGPYRGHIVVGQGNVKPASVGLPTIQTTGNLSTTQVQAFVISHPFPGGAAQGSVKVTQLRAMTAGQFDASRHDDLGLPVTEPVIYVQLAGSFHITGVTSPQGSPSTSSATSVYEVFDATTGNLMEWGL